MWATRTATAYKLVRLAKLELAIGGIALKLPSRVANREMAAAAAASAPPRAGPPNQGRDFSWIARGGYLAAHVGLGGGLTGGRGSPAWTHDARGYGVRAAHQQLGRRRDRHGGTASGRRRAGIPGADEGRIAGDVRSGDHLGWQGGEGADNDRASVPTQPHDRSSWCRRNRRRYR